MSSNQIHRSRIPKDETKGRSAPQASVCTPSLKTSSTGSAGLYKPGFPHGLRLTGTMPAEDVLHKGKNLDLYA